MLAVALEPNSILNRSPLRLLIVEDNPADAELSVALLERAGYVFTCDIVDSEPNFQECLQRNEYDVIISDHNLLTWTGLDALDVVRQSRRDTPFIVVTAVLGDETAVDYIKRGANDYVLKHRLESLPVAIGRALREKQRAEEAMRLQERILRAKKEWELTFDAVPDPILLLDRQCRILRANRAAAELAGLQCSQLIGQRCYEVIAGLCAPSSGCPLEQALATGREARSEVSDARSGKIYEAAVSPLRESGGEVSGCVCVLRDVTGRKQAEIALRRSEERYRNLFENASDMVCTLDLAGNFTSLNKTGEAISGYTRQELLARNFSEIVPPEYVPRIRREARRALTGAMVEPLELQIVAKNGRTIPLEVNGNAVWKDARQVEILAIARDVTLRNELAKQLIQSQKMEVVGQLAGGVAHDFNNLLGVIVGFSDLLLERLSAGDPQIKYVEQIKKAADRAVAVTRQLLAFSRKQVLQLRELQLNTLLEEMEPLIRHLVGERIDLGMMLDPGLGQIRADPGQVQQLVMNLIMNSRDAMPKGGTLTIQTMNARLDEDCARRHPDVRPGNYVTLAVSDSGMGMDAETKSHIFEPFFTTKPAGKGTGLGLSTAYGIVRQSGGHIWVYSEPGEGATFKIFLPRIAGVGETEMFNMAIEAPSGGGATVLVVEDESSVRELVHEFLESDGYILLEAKGGAEALEIAEQDSSTIDLLLTDVVMPGISGPQLVQRLATLRPGMQVLYMSGYPVESVDAYGMNMAASNFIAKPFTREALLRKVRDVLESHSQ